MATPNRAPRRTTANAGVNLAQGTPVPGANAQTYARKTASVTDAAQAQAAKSAPSGLTPNNVAVNKDTSPQADA